MNTEANFQSHRARRVVRQKSFLRGMIHLNDARTTFDCMIRDISPGGARLDFSGTTPTPDFFELHIPLKEQVLRASVAWRLGERVGVAFAHQASTIKPSQVQDLSHRLDRIEVEIDTFKRECQKLRFSMRPIRL
jgi:hypothetical protein